MRKPSKKGFYLVSPLLGFFFFLIAMSVTAFFVTENNQHLESATSTVEDDIVFTSYAIQADAFDVYFQNYLQDFLDTFDISNPGSGAIKTAMENAITNTISTDIRATYKEVYNKSFGITCATGEKAYSTVILRFPGALNSNLFGPPPPPPGTDYLFYRNYPINRDETVIWPYTAHYTLKCSVPEPPVDAQIEFRSRWYHLDADCICCQNPSACDDSIGAGLVPFEDCHTACNT
jgi:hypothetical protein